MSVMSKEGGANAPSGSDTITISCTMDNVLYPQTTQNKSNLKYFM